MSVRLAGAYPHATVYHSDGRVDHVVPNIDAGRHHVLLTDVGLYTIVVLANEDRP
jgi:hypothetical protein